jgi:serine/threonine-protein kinase
MALVCSACSFSNPDHARFCAGCGARLGDAGAERDPLFGQLVHDRYRVVRVLGEGGMGRVYYAEQQMGATARPVAIKVLRGSTGDGVAVSRFTRECELVVQLTHPSTIRFYDFGKLPDGRLYIAMEYVDGRSLAKAIEEGPMPLPVVERLVGQIGGALTEAHRRGIVHRDLKPDNILLAHNPDEGEFAKVLDFGIAKQADTQQSEITSEGLIVGTPAYMSPEQLSGKPVDERSDVYALGLIVFEMLTGRRPFAECRTPLEWATAHITKDPPSFDAYPSTRDLPRGKREAIYHALAKEPSLRTHSVRAFLEELLGAQRMSLLAIAPSSDRTARPIGEAATLAATPRSVLTPAKDRISGHEPDRLPVSRGPWVAAGGLAAVALGALLFVAMRGIGAEPTTPSLPDASVPIDAGSDAPAPSTESWFRMVSGSDRTTDVTQALGEPDGRCATISPRGKLLLELAPGTRIRTDGRATPDLRVVVSDSSAPYRVDVLVERHEAQTQVGADVVGSISIDVDQFEQAEFRYIRVKNPGARGTVCVDAVAAFVTPI